ncbi:thiamine phosphate synthase [Kaistia dalseonensis]|uniref:Thiamine-phosphate synthase n=1 Tax=Kaistia dalseonensis TaxID=410840 RepID=A0ABU0H6X2_9HYPH|nr:thiamine phosphate synthase [Kaistia dalseonensis]MCX5495463.1 thiamine phosphate synthase [Kaistia dalseonensis]MDQ0438054.1 thiamine-phosphate pyrophosphorylase [Kaistia dalseonensis]
MARPFDLSLYLVTDEGLAGPRGVVETVRAAIEGGVTLVQLRDPHNKTRHLIETATALLQLLKPRGIPLIINDRVDVCLAIDADGVHVGQSDMPASMVRGLIGPDRILGLSVSTFPELEASDVAYADYLGVGPIFATATKPNAAAPIGFDGLAAMVAASPKPVVAIGGVKADHVEPTLGAGADGLAIVSAIMAADDPAAAASSFAERIARYRAE